MSLNFQSWCLHLPRTWITGMHCYFQPVLPLCILRNPNRVHKICDYASTCHRSRSIAVLIPQSVLTFQFAMARQTPILIWVEPLKNTSFQLRSGHHTKAREHSFSGFPCHRSVNPGTHERMVYYIPCHKGNISTSN